MPLVSVVLRQSQNKKIPRGLHRKAVFQSLFSSLDGVNFPDIARKFSCKFHENSRTDIFKNTSGQPPLKHPELSSELPVLTFIVS